MAAETRWVEYSVAAATSAYIGATTSGVGTRGYVEALSTVGDKFTIGPTNNVLAINMNSGSNHNITLTSGVDLDPRFVARDITEKLHADINGYPGWEHSTCEWINNKFYIYSGDIGAASDVTVFSGTNSAYGTLGFTSNNPVGGGAHSYKVSNYDTGGISVSGTWEGMFDERYTIIINKETTLGTPGGTHPNWTGTFTTGGQYQYSADTTYTITIDGTNGLVVGGGTGNVPKFSWTNTDNSDNSSSAIEILYSDHWYNIGTRGVKVKWSDNQFYDGNTWTIPCTHPTEAKSGSSDAKPGQALYTWTSERGDECSTPSTTSASSFTNVGTRGLSIKFDDSDQDLQAGDEFRVICTAPQPTVYDISSLNYGNVTVTTESPVKCVLFEIMSGAVMMTAVKFGLQSHGSFSYHGTGDTYFRYGTVGGDAVAGGGTTNHKEWRTNVVAADLSAIPCPNYLAGNDPALAVVSSADDSEVVGNYQGGLVSDFIFLCIKLGGDETGSNSSINHRLYFDYS